MARVVKLLVLVVVVAFVSIMIYKNCGSCGGRSCAKQANCHYVDADGDGKCDNAGKACCQSDCKEFTDADNDGKCDKCGIEMKDKKENSCKSH